MRSLAALDRRGEALRCFAELRRNLAQELAIEPGPDARRLYLSLLQQDRAGMGADPVTGRSELRTLLLLLRQTLESIPGTKVPDEDDNLSALAARLVGAA
jgi:DNA-binding SARP family transcriptional activator